MITSKQILEYIIYQLTKSHDGCIPVVPAGVVDVGIDEGEDVRDDVVLNARSEQHDTHACRLARVPLVVVIRLLLLAQHLHQDRHQVLETGREREGCFRLTQEQLYHRKILAFHSTKFVICKSYIKLMSS